MWHKDKQRPSAMDDWVKQDKKDGKLAPNAYFKTDSKTGTLDGNKLVE